MIIAAHCALKAFAIAGRRADAAAWLRNYYYFTARAETD
jgi:hypothetical protein